MLDHTCFYTEPETVPFPAVDCPIDAAALPSSESLLRRKLTVLQGQSAAPIRLHSFMPQAVRRRVSARFGVEVKADPEAYVVEVASNGIDLYSLSQRGLFFAVQALMRLWEAPSLHRLLLYDAPVVPVRWLKVLLPPPTAQGKADFRLLADLLVRWRFNGIMLELGGAMEYKSHPEIAEGWKEYAAFMNEYPGKALEVQQRYDYEKDSIHATNGGGEVWSQAELHELIEICRERHLEIIPEVPCLSHADYLLVCHPELAERQGDPFPETCCPSEPAVYRLLFDLLEEVIGLFRPARISIGHDEYYSIGLCDRCKGHPAEELYAGDVNRIAEFLTQRNIETLVAADKLLPARLVNGKPMGGSECSPSGKNVIPPTYPALDLIRNDVTLLHWYWCVDRKLEERLYGREFRVLFWNFTGSCFPEWKRRRSHPNLEGIVISNWGALDLRTLQRNGIFFELAYASALCWNPGLDDGDNRAITDAVTAELFACRNALRTPGQRLVVEHQTTATRPFRYYYDGNFLDEEKFLLGHHRFRGKSSGCEFRFPVVWGTNISHSGVRAYAWEDTDPGREFDQYRIDPLFQEIVFETLPIREEHGEIFFRCAYDHPAPDEELNYEGFLPLSGTEIKVRMINWYVEQ